MNARHSTLVLQALMFGIVSASAQSENKLELLKVIGVEGAKSVERVWTVDAARLKRASVWQDENKSPQLTIPDAIRAARTYLRSKGQSSKLPIKSVTLKRPLKLEENSNYFFFVVSFNDWDTESPSPVGFDVIVLLDGSVVIPNEPPK